MVPFFYDGVQDAELYFLHPEKVFVLSIEVDLLCLKAFIMAKLKLLAVCKAKKH